MTHCQFRRDGDLLICDSCSRSLRTAAAPDAVFRRCGDARSCPPVNRQRPGDELKSLLESLDIYDDSGCGCDAMRRNMNSWRVAGCRERREQIVDYLASKAAERGWGTKIWAAVRAVAAGATWLNPLDVYGSLTDEAIRRAESATAAAAELA